jgi:hypothetical protein
MYGYGVATRIEQVSQDVFRVNPGSLVLSGKMDYHRNRATSEQQQAIIGTTSLSVCLQVFCRMPPQKSGSALIVFASIGR